MVCKRYLIFAGRGGHEAQARRLHSLMLSNGIDARLIVEDGGLLANVSDFSKNHSNFNAKILFSLLFYLVKFYFNFERDQNPVNEVVIIFLGPLNNVPPMLLCRYFGYSCIFIESWSRFQNFSQTYKLARLLKFRLFVQNESLFRSGENLFVGRLG